MKVYVVIGGMDEGFIPWTTMEVFDTIESADAYAHQLTVGGIVDEDGEIDIYDFSRVFEREVE